MLRFVVFVVAVALGSSAYAQSAPHSPTKQRKVAPTAQAADDPNDVSAVPRNVQKWIGGAVDDILTGADKAVDPGNDKR